MAKKIHHFKGFSVIEDGVDIRVDMDRLENNFNRAQYALDSAIMTSMEPLMPMETGQFIAVTKEMSAAVAGTGQVVAAATPSGRFLYEGQAMIGRYSKSAWAKKGEKKVLSGKSLTYTRGGPKWFDKAKAKDGDNWVRIVKKEVGK
jgi:hypothetical protein